MLVLARRFYSTILGCFLCSFITFELTSRFARTMNIVERA